MDLTYSWLCSQELARGRSSEAKSLNPELHILFLYREHHHQQKGTKKKEQQKFVKLLSTIFNIQNLQLHNNYLQNFSKNET